MNNLKRQTNDEGYVNGIETLIEDIFKVGFGQGTTMQTLILNKTDNKNKENNIVKDMLDSLRV